MRVKRHVEDLKQLGLQPEEIVEMPEVRCTLLHKSIPSKTVIIHATFGSSLHN